MGHESPSQSPCLPEAFLPAHRALMKVVSHVEYQEAKVSPLLIT